ncbi:unnamed protein product, partial [Coregonus sp. 'balchen']
HPQLTVSSTVIRERESVQLSCETPPSLHVSHCYFYIEGVKNLPDSSFTQTITGTELLKRADPPPPRLTVSCTVIRERDSIQLSCETPPSVSCSPKLTQQFIPDRWPMFIRVFLSRDRLFGSTRAGIVRLYLSRVRLFHPSRDHPKPDIKVHFDEYFNIYGLISGSVSPDTTCNLYVGEESQLLLTAKIWKEKTKASKQWFCKFSVTESDLIRRLQSVRRKEVSCDY